MYCLSTQSFPGITIVTVDDTQSVSDPSLCNELVALEPNEAMQLIHSVEQPTFLMMDREDYIALSSGILLMFVIAAGVRFVKSILLTSPSR